MRKNPRRGPWTASKDTDTRGNPCWRIDTPDISLLAVLTYASNRERDDAEIDARVISAAPVMRQRLRLIAELAHNATHGTLNATTAMQAILTAAHSALEGT